MSNNNPILAIACGPIVTTWDVSKSSSQTLDSTAVKNASTSLHENNNHSSVIDTTSLSRAELISMGIGQFKPFTGRHDVDNDGNSSIVNDIAWNHNGQVLATCSNHSSNDSSLDPPHNVALTVYSTKTQTELESFSTNINNTKNPSTYPQPYYRTTSLSFGGITSKSRYVCLSDDGGYISIWDMKKQPVKRARHFHLQQPKSSTTVPSCSKACIDPTDTFVIGLHDYDNKPQNTQTQHVTLDIFHLKKGSIIATLQDDGTHAGSSNCFHCSNIATNQLLVGTKDGSILLWDLSSSSISSSTAKYTSTASSYISPIVCLDKRHDGIVTNVEFSPMNKVLAASCSLDGTVVFHDVLSQKKIQTLRPSINRDDNSGVSLTSLAFHSNGYTWAIGTNNGYVMNYDLRQISSGPLSMMNVGQEVPSNTLYPVNKLAFSPSPSTSKTPKTIHKPKTTSTTLSDIKSKVDSPLLPSSKTSSVVKELFQTQNNTNDENQSYYSQQQSPLNKSVAVSPSVDTDKILESFDKMYERLQNRDNTYPSPNILASNQKLKKDRDLSYSSPSKDESYMKDVKSMDSINMSGIQSPYNRDDVVMITKGKIQEMIDDAVEALRDDMDEALQRMHCDFMRQLQRQADETKLILDHQMKEIESLRKENSSLKATSDGRRLF